VGVKRRRSGRREGVKKRNPVKPQVVWRGCINERMKLQCVPKGEERNRETKKKKLQGKRRGRHQKEGGKN